MLSAPLLCMSCIFISLRLQGERELDITDLCCLLGVWGTLPCILTPFDFLSLHQRAGYSLQELFHLTRSQVSQQRALALHVLSQIIGRVSGLQAWSSLAPPHPSPLGLRLFFFVL